MVNKMRDLDIPQSGSSELSKKASALYDRGAYDEAILLFQEELKKNPTQQAYYNLGRAFVAQGNGLEAIKALTESIRIDKTDHESFALMGDCYLSLGRGIAALESYAQAVAYKPDNQEYKQKLIRVATLFKFKKTNPNLKGVLIECLESNDLDLNNYGRSWISIVSRDASVGPFYKLSKFQKYSAFKKEIEKFPNCDGLIEPFFLIGFGKFIVNNFVFETWCKHLRRYMLDVITEGKNIFSDPEDIDLITCALSRYCFFTDYIMGVTEEEKTLLESLKKKVLATDSPNLSELACLGCYEHIYFLDNANEIAKNLKGGDHVSQIPKAQIEDYLEQQVIKQSIPTFTKIENEVSSAVREQYEAFPYPRWHVAAKDLYTPEIEGHLKDKKAKILVAGSGTGKEAIQVAYTFPDAQITAVDLSQSSLAYAIFKARELGIKNINFGQGDIMELSSLEDKFDYITSSGVLHHMKDPKAGWQVLYDLLKPKGLMRIALYSRQARWGINDARNVIKEKNIGSDSQSIKDFRANLQEHIKYKSIKNLEMFFDFFNLPECRDLLFHVQEHQYDLIEIKGILDDLGLEFLRFYLPEKSISKYKKHHKNDEDISDLEAWAKWEEKNPDLFASMYTFWCRKI